MGNFFPRSIDKFINRKILFKKIIAYASVDLAFYIIKGICL